MHLCLLLILGNCYEYIWCPIHWGSSYGMNELPLTANTFFFPFLVARACLKSCVFQSQCFQNFPTTTNRKTFFYNVIWCVCIYTYTHAHVHVYAHECTHACAYIHEHLKQNFTKQYILSTLSNIFQCFIFYFLETLIMTH